MKRIRNAVISDINEVITVYSKKGRLYKTISGVILAYRSAKAEALRIQ